MSSDKGYVYVLSNPSMPGIVKIGRSMYGGQGRADALYKNDTGVALPFKLEFEVFTEKHQLLEKDIHADLEKVRVNSSREFFRISVEEASIVVGANAIVEKGATATHRITDDDIRVWCSIFYMRGKEFEWNKMLLRKKYSALLCNDIQDSDSGFMHYQLMKISARRNLIDVVELGDGDFELSITREGVDMIESSFRNRSDSEVATVHGFEGTDN